MGLMSFTKARREAAAKARKAQEEQGKEQSNPAARKKPGPKPKE